MLDWTQLHKCDLCPALGSHQVGPSGPLNASLFIVGQSPGVREVEEGTPFCGPSGGLLDFLLDELLLDRDMVYVTNAVKCHPPNNRPGDKEEIETCKKTWLLRELKEVKPKVVLALGADAFCSLVGKSKRKHFGHGKVWRREKRSLISFYHPSYFLRRHDLEGFLLYADRIKAELDFWEGGNE